MKKAVLFLSVAVLLLCAVFGCSGTAKEGSASERVSKPAAASTAEPTAEPAAEIKTGVHEREEGYPNPFKTHYIETETAIVHMEDAIFEETVLRESADTIAADMHTIGDVLGEATEKVTVYLAEHVNRPVLLNGHIICTVDDLCSGTYREALCGASCGLMIPWKQIGLAAYVFGGIDESGLVEYYADRTHALTASCAAMYLLDGFAGTKTAEAARKTAQSMTLFLLNSGSLSALQSVVSTAEILPAWQAKLGIETPIELPAGSEYAGTVTADDDAVYLCIVRRGNTVFRLEKDCFCDTPDDLYRFLCAYFTGEALVLDKIRSELPGYAALAEERLSSPLVIVLISESYGQSGGPMPDRLALHEGDLAPHELVHKLLWTDINSHDQEQMLRVWQSEAIAEHFSLEAITLAFPEPEREGFDAFIEEWFSEEWKTDPDYCKAFWNVYCAEKEQNALTANGIRDEYAWQSAIGVCGLLFENDPLKASERTVAEKYGYKPEEADGLELTYEEALIFMEYLFDRFGTETVVDAYMNEVPFAEAFGREYAELYADCIAYLNETYGSLLADPD